MHMGNITQEPACPSYKLSIHFENPQSKQKTKQGYDSDNSWFLKLAYIPDNKNNEIKN